MFKEIRTALEKNEQDWRQIARADRIINDLKRQQRHVESAYSREQAWARLFERRQVLSLQLLDATTTRPGQPPATVPMHDKARQLQDEIDAIDDQLRQYREAPAAREDYRSKLGADLRVELSVLGHQVLLILGIAVANIIFFGLLILVFPYVWDWFFSFP